MTEPNELAAVAFLIDPKHRPIAEGGRRYPLWPREFPLGAILVAGLFSFALAAPAAFPAREGEFPPIVLAALALGGACNLGMLYLLGKQVRPFLKNWRLSRHGSVVPGEVIFCAGTRDEAGSLVVSMKYRFQTPGGKSIESVERFNGRRLPGESLPSPRTALAVCYAGEDCFEVL